MMEKLEIERIRRRIKRVSCDQKKPNPWKDEKRDLPLQPFQPVVPPKG